MSIIAATRIDPETRDRALRLRTRTQLSMSDLLRLGLLRVIHEYETRGKISVGEGWGKLQNSNAKLQEDGSEPVGDAPP